MPMDGVTLGFIARELDGVLRGGRVDRITQPERDEVIITVRSQGGNHALLVSASAGNARAHLTTLKKANPLEPPMFCQLLRKHLLGGRVLEIRQIDGDRILEMDVESADEMRDRTVKTLVCEFMGKHSNLILVRADGRIIDSARHVTDDISRVREVLPGLDYRRPPEHGKLPYDRLDEDSLAARLEQFSAGTLARALSQSVSGLSPQTARELAFRVSGDEARHAGECDAGIIAQRVVKTLNALRGEFAPAVILDEEGLPADVVAFPYKSRAAYKTIATATLSEAMDEFYRARDLAERIKQKSSALHRVLKNNIERCEKKLALQLEALCASERMEEYRLKGELLTANLHLARKGQKSCRVPNYYDPECAPMDIELDEKLSPGQNAKRYFKLYQKARSARELAAEQRAKTQAELDYLEGQMDNLEKCTEESELSEIRAELEQQGYVRANHNRRQMKALAPSSPLHFISSAGAHILVGKNNLQNEKLTQTANPTDVWLHAKDMPGSHVIIAQSAPDDQTLLEAALLAAYYSKGRSSSLVPVDYTQRKYVKKPGGSKPGFVIYTHQRTLYVTPEPDKLKSIAQAGAK